MREGRISRPDGSFDPAALADRIVELHTEVEEEESRAELVALYDALMSSSERGLIAEGRDPGPLREVWRRTHLSFIVAESLTDGEVDAGKLARVNAREVAAGRLHPEEVVQIRKADPAPAPEPAAVPDEPPPAAPDEPPSSPDGYTPSALELAYRAIFLWEEERMEPRIDGLVEQFRARLGELEPGPAESFRSAAEQEALHIGRWFEENEEAFIRAAVSYLDDDVIRGLEALGVAEQFHGVIFEAIDDARADLAGRLSEVRDAACRQAPPAG